MYQNLAVQRGLHAEVVDDHFGDPRDDTISLFISGPGAHALFVAESGLHHLTRGRKHDGKGTTEREAVRVEVLPFPAGDAPFKTDELQVELKPLNAKRGRLLVKLNYDVRLFHTPTMTSVRAWCDGSKAEAVERCKLLCAPASTPCRLTANRRWFGATALGQLRSFATSAAAAAPLDSTKYLTASSICSWCRPENNCLAASKAFNAAKPGVDLLI